MALTQWSEFKDAIDDWLARSDLDSGGFAADFITLGETRIYRDLRVRQMETALSVSISSGVAAVPDTYRELRFAYIDGDPVQWLDIAPLQKLYAEYPTRSSDGKPCLISREGSNFVFGPYPDSGYTVKGIYYSRLTALSGSNTTNWLTDDHPDLLLFAALAEAADFLGDDAAVSKWEGKYERKKMEVEAEDRQERFPRGMALAARPG